ncbi:MAG TPA: hypothetical protein VF178_10955 [Gemmatimonadaceae bacterium]
MMARQRFVKPDVFQHEELHRAETVSGLPIIRAYIGLWTQCDRRGCFVWKPATLKLNILPFDAVDFGAVLSVLEEHGFIVRYSVAGKDFGWVPTLPLHQTFHKNEKPNPLIPDPPEHLRSTVQARCQHSACTPVVTTALTTALTTASTSSARDGHPAAPANGGEDDDDDAFRRGLVVAANMAITQRFGEQTRPILPGAGSTSDVASELRSAGIPLGFAQASIVRQVEEDAKQVPRHLGYFRNGILTDWEAHKALLDAKGSGPIAPLAKPKSYLETELRRLTGS